MSAMWEYVWRQVPEMAVARYLELKPQITEIWAKEASWPRRYFELTQLLPAQQPLPFGIPSKPSPMFGTLLGGMAGAGLGYGLGALGETVMPRTWQRGRLRNSLAMLGGGIGAIPGLAAMGFNRAGGDPLNGTDMLGGKGYDHNTAIQAADAFHNRQQNGRWELMPWSEYEQQYGKQSSADNTGLSAMYSFDPDEFNEMIWSDPRLSNRIDPPTRAAASGIVSGAANLPGKSVKLVTPFDIGRMALGLGSGYLSGALVGKGLGLLMGMPEKTQETLKNTGMYAGLISNLIPAVFGG